MARKPIRIAVAGLGRIGWVFHCRQIAEHPEFTLAAVQDVNAARRKEAEQVYGVRAYGDFTQMLDEVEPQVVVVATPTHFHRPMAVEALRAGCDVLLEKPMAENSQSAAAIVRAAKQHDRILTVYQPHRVSADFQHLRRIIESGAIGEIYHVRVGGFRYARRDDWQSLTKFGGGMLANYGAHSLDQLLQLVGYDVKKVFCTLRVVASLGDADDVVKVLFETRKGKLGELDINQASVIQPFLTQVWGTHGAITLSLNRDTLTVKRFDPASLPARKLDRSLASAGRKYPMDNPDCTEETIPVDRSLAVDFYADLARALHTRKDPFVKPEEPLAVMRLIDRCRADSGRIVKTKD